MALKQLQIWNYVGFPVWKVGHILAGFFNVMQMSPPYKFEHKWTQKDIKNDTYTFARAWEREQFNETIVIPCSYSISTVRYMSCIYISFVCILGPYPDHFTADHTVKTLYYTPYLNLSKIYLT